MFRWLMPCGGGGVCVCWTAGCVGGGTCVCGAFGSTMGWTNLGFLVNVFFLAPARMLRSSGLMASTFLPGFHEVTVPVTCVPW
jgi:hypothetical protein